MPNDYPDELAPPPDLRADHVTLNGTEWLILSFPRYEPELPTTLTSAERAVARAVVRGLSNDDIARERGTSVRTVANQLASIFHKTNVRSRIELVRSFTRRAVHQ